MESGLLLLHVDVLHGGPNGTEVRECEHVKQATLWRCLNIQPNGDSLQCSNLIAKYRMVFLIQSTLMVSADLGSGDLDFFATLSATPTRGTAGCAPTHAGAGDLFGQKMCTVAVFELKTRISQVKITFDCI